MLFRKKKPLRPEIEKLLRDCVATMGDCHQKAEQAHKQAQTLLDKLQPLLDEMETQTARAAEALAEYDRQMKEANHGESL